VSQFADDMIRSLRNVLTRFEMLGKWSVAGIITQDISATELYCQLLCFCYETLWISLRITRKTVNYLTAILNRCWRIWRAFGVYPSWITTWDQLFGFSPLQKNPEIVLNIYRLSASGVCPACSSRHDTLLHFTESSVPVADPAAINWDKYNTPK
jgi:Zn ribbon nucleic-acid-binding protein